jgi:hypothetical protein
VVEYLVQLEPKVQSWLVKTFNQGLTKPTTRFRRIHYLLRHTIFNLGILRLQVTNRGLETPDWSETR